MTDALLATAARLLRREARQIRDANIVWRNGGARKVWGEEALTNGAKADYDEMMDVAKRLAARGRE